MDSIHVCMLGELSLRYKDNIISDAGNRSKKVWNLIACLLCNRDRAISSQMLIDIIWGDDSSSANPENTLRITLHRARAMLDQLWDGAGRALIIHKDDGYIWNSEVEIIVDGDVFLDLIGSDRENEDAYLENLLKAIDLYKGAFLPRQGSEMWAIPLATHFQAAFLNAAMDAADLLSTRGRHEEAADICQKAAAAEPYHEPLHQRLMQALADAGNIQGVNAVYEKLCKRLNDDFGIQPGEETRAVHRKATHASKDKPLPVEEILKDLHEAENPAGAMECDYDYFKVLCFAKSRDMERSGEITHIALMNIGGGPDGAKDKNAEKTMEMLGQLLKSNLRRGDVISKCSASQYIVMLPKANYENSCMVCRRVIAAFAQKHGPIASKINFIVQPLTADMKVP